MDGVESKMGIERDEPSELRSATATARGSTGLGSYGPGVCCWTELRTTNVARATEFYGDLFGWSAREIVVAPTNESYTIVGVGGLALAAVCPRDAGQSSGARDYWRFYAALKGRARASSLDGRAVRPSVKREPSITRAGRWASPEHPLGAIFAATRAASQFGDEGALQSAVMWIDLGGDAAPESAAFFRAFFDLADEDPGGRLLLNQGAMSAATGLLMLGGSSSRLPPWSVGFAVTDCDATLRRARTLGGQVAAPAEMVENVGRAAAVVDPQGAVFVCWEPQDRTSMRRSPSPRARPAATLPWFATAVPSRAGSVARSSASTSRSPRPRRPGD
jgi:predicted enzyme related to lactoylglutathione lyase